MEIRIELPDQDPTFGQRYAWDDGYLLALKVNNDGSCVVTGNAAGLRSLARHLLVLSLPGVEDGSHVHLDESTGMDRGSDELILQRSDTGRTDHG
jgi:hypothetical protein